MGFSVKVGQLAEEHKAVVDLLAGELLQPLGAKTLAGERAHHTAVEHGAAEGGRSEFACRGGRSQVAEEAAGKAVARAGGVHHFLQRQGRGTKWVRFRPFPLGREAVIAEKDEYPKEIFNVVD